MKVIVITVIIFVVLVLFLAACFKACADSKSESERNDLELHSFGSSISTGEYIDCSKQLEFPFSEIKESEERMTLEEAIKHCEEVAANRCGKCAEEHKQLSEWLQDYRRML